MMFMTLSDRVKGMRINGNLNYSLLLGDIDRSYLLAHSSKIICLLPVLLLEEF